MAKKYYMVMVDHWFKCQDGADSMEGEYSGIIHTTKKDAEAELKEAFKNINTEGDYPFIKEIENG